jgi:hypothetical protein
MQERVAATWRYEAQVEIGQQLRVAYRPPAELPPQMVALIAQMIR